MKFNFFWILSIALLVFMFAKADVNNNRVVNFSERKNASTKGI